MASRFVTDFGRTDHPNVRIQVRHSLEVDAANLGVTPDS